MLGRVTRRASRIGMQRVKLVFSIVITELIVPKNTKIKQNTTLSICFEKGGKVSSTRSFNFDLNKNTVNPLNNNMPCVAIPINEKVELVATLYKDPSTGKYQAKEGKILLRKLKKNAIAGIDAFKGIGIHALQLHELATELGFEMSLTKEVELPFSRLDHSSIKATITTRFLRELNADEVDETMSQFSMLSDASDMSTLGATFRYDDLEGVSKKAGMGDERFMGTTSTDSTPRDGKDVSGFYPVPLGSISSGNAILSTPLKRKSGTGFISPRTGDSTGGRTPSPGMGHVDISDQNEEYPLHKKHGSGHRLMELHKAQEDAARSQGTPPLSPRASELRDSDTKRNSIPIIAEAEVESEVESEMGTPSSRLKRRVSSDDKVTTASTGIACTGAKLFPVVTTTEEDSIQTTTLNQGDSNVENPPDIVEVAERPINKGSNSSAKDDSQRYSVPKNTMSDEPSIEDVGKLKETLPPKAEEVEPVITVSDNERASTDSKVDSDEGEVLVPSIPLPPQATSPKPQQQTEVISLSRKELVTRANREAFELYQKELNARAERIKQLEEQLKLQATGYKAEIMTLKTELNTVHADLHMRVVGGGNNSNSGSYAAWRDRSVSAAARKNVWGSAVMHDSESDEDHVAGSSDMGSDDGIAAAAIAAVRDSEDFDAGLASRREGIAEKFEPEDEDRTKSSNTGSATNGLPPIAAGRRGSHTELLQQRYANFSRRTSATSLLSPAYRKGSIADTKEEISIKNGLEEARESSIYFNNDHIAALRAVAAAAMKEKVSKEEKAAAAAAAAVEVAASTLSAAAADGDNAMIVLMDAASAAGTNESLATGILNASMMDTANDGAIFDASNSATHDEDEVPVSPTKSESAKSRNNVSFAVSSDIGLEPSEHSKQSLTRSMVMRNPAAEEAVADLVAEYGRTTAELEMMAHDLYFYKELAEKAMEEKAEETMAAREAATAAVEANMRRAVVEEEYKDMSEKVVQLMMEQGRMQVRLKEERRKNQALKNRMLQYAEKMGALEVRFSNVDINDVLAATAPSPMPNSPIASRTSSTNRK